MSIDTLFLGIAGKVVCLNKQDGTELWRTQIKRGALTNVCAEGDYIYAYSGGHMFCLSAANGDVLWENPLKGCGFGNAIIASSQQSGALIAGAIATSAAAAAASPTHNA